MIIWLNGQKLIVSKEIKCLECYENIPTFLLNTSIILSYYQYCPFPTPGPESQFYINKRCKINSRDIR